MYQVCKAYVCVSDLEQNFDMSKEKALSKNSTDFDGFFLQTKIITTNKWLFPLTSFDFFKNILAFEKLQDKAISLSWFDN